jgi:hypothetical protein
MKKPFRIAMRTEGDWWVAYFAPIDTMDDALELSRVRRSLVERHREIRQAFIDFNTKLMGIAVEATGAKVDHWDTQRAPEHERSGHG